MPSQMDNSFITKVAYPSKRFYALPTHLHIRDHGLVKGFYSFRDKTGFYNYDNLSTYRLGLRVERDIIYWPAVGSVISHN